MKSFDQALENCLERIKQGETVDACLRRYRAYARELRPLLMAALELEVGASVRPTEVFKRRSRREVADYIQSHPRARSLQRPSVQAPRLLRPAGLIVGLFSALVLVFFTTGTVLAQQALPGQILYPWKRTSETVWQAVSPNPVATNLAISQRRTHEALSVSGPERTVALQGYEQVLDQLATQAQGDESAQQQVIIVLTLQRDDLAKLGITLPKLNDYLSHPGKKPDKHSPTVTPEATRMHKKHKKMPETGGGADEPSMPTPVYTPTPLGTPAPLPTGSPVFPATLMPLPVQIIGTSTP